MATAGGDTPETVVGASGHAYRSRELLAPLCACFTEGFDTAAVRDARAVLDTRAEGQ
jgi:hypothetical protein